ncbi:MAG: preprotein translocase subunit SecY [Cytophagales bacterium]|nr:preprotein translocase subunit SecY [Cytophagales bacterium]MDW8385248.1 preprotein translocase subunit SecY [Flammeovirgaceae bacterium]
MKKFITTFQNIFSIEELRNKILYTLAFLAIFRLGSFVVLPGINPDKIGEAEGGVLGLLNTLLGGAFSRASIFALGIMPYISASIVVQLLTVAVPYFQRLQKEGDSGRKRINQITRVLTIAITIAQGGGYIASTIPAEAIMINTTLFTVSSIIILTTGTMFCMWLGEKITERGIGNGISMLIMVGIISGFPTALVEEFKTRGTNGLLLFVIELVALYVIIMGVILITQATRRIPIQYARQMVGSSKASVQGQRSYIPLKVNSANVMPIIFAQSLMFLPSLIGNIWIEKSDFARYIAQVFSSYTSWQYNLTLAVLIILFTFFYTAITINPKQMSDDLKRNNAFIPGVQPGDATSNYISSVLDRITLPGALFLVVIAILPAFANAAGVSVNFAQFYGGTSLIIMVGVILDTLQQIESYLLMKHYDGMMQSGRIKGRVENIEVV